MVLGGRWKWLLGAAATAWVLAACSSDTGDSASDDDGDPNQSSAAIGVAGRWKLPSDVRTIGAQVRVTYDGPGAWRGGAGCTGGMRAGAKTLRTFLLGKFPSNISSIDGYACRQNTANTSQLSVHGTGRALDIFIPKSGGQADNTRGDPVANWLVTHAQEIGVQLIIWDRSIWRANGTNEGAYGGPHPHDDHIHAEIDEEAAKQQTPFFATGGQSGGTPDTGSTGSGSTDTGSGSGSGSGTPAPTPAPAPSGGGGQSCASDGQCNPGNDGSGLICEAGQCVPGCRIDAQCPGVTLCVDGQCQ